MNSNKNHTFLYLAKHMENMNSNENHTFLHMIKQQLLQNANLVFKQIPVMDILREILHQFIKILNK